MGFKFTFARVAPGNLRRAVSAAVFRMRVRRQVIPIVVGAIEMAIGATTVSGGPAASSYGMHDEAADGERKALQTGV